MIGQQVMEEQTQHQIDIREATNADMPGIVALSQQWEAENITYGYVSCTPEILGLYRVWVASTADTVIGFLFGKKTMSDELCVIPAGAATFEVEDFYLLPEFRNLGIGKNLLHHVEKQLQGEGTKYLLLSTATKDHQKIVKFYLETGFTVWTTTLFKQI